MVVAIVVVALCAGGKVQATIDVVDELLGRLGELRVRGLRGLIGFLVAFGVQRIKNGITDAQVGSFDPKGVRASKLHSFQTSITHSCNRRKRSFTSRTVP